MEKYKDLIEELKKEYSAESTADIYRDEKYSYKTHFKKNTYRNIFLLSLFFFIFSTVITVQFLTFISVICMLWSALGYNTNVKYDEGAIEGVMVSYPLAQVQYKLELLNNKETEDLVISSLASDLEHLEYDKSKERQGFRKLLLDMALKSYKIESRNES